jgi:hypothetical protein
MKEYLVSAKGTEWLAEAVIEANTPDEAEAHYREAWSNGEISANGYEFSNWSIKETHTQKENRSKTYVARFSMIEGEHEHHAAFLLRAESHDEAYALAKSQEHEPEIPDEDEDGEKELTYWDYGDGTTASRLLGVLEITKEEVHSIERLGLACYFN